jgi:hypothetical protein
LFYMACGWDFSKKILCIMSHSQYKVGVYRNKEAQTWYDTHTLDQVHCRRDNIFAQKSVPIPFHPTQLDAPVLHAFDNSHGLIFKD